MPDLSAFRRACYEVARRTGGEVIEFRLGDGVTPNFSQGVIGYRDRSVAVVLTRDTGVAALAVPREVTGPDQESGPLTFVDDPHLLGALAGAGLTVLTAAELDAPFQAAQWPAVSPADVKYWQPYSVGEALFNYWD
ncbi:hypothetical protein [Actinoplanes sp. M2I2]|uniref:hypothetical protein n=1 Tax=Actinoplanes sp. M2I2 TaxID=1734444 RepID=UPI0020220BB6|nr:hypothetical protein [Actinoplanes sp. M2I2]